MLAGDETIVFSVRADPEPESPVVNGHREGPMVRPNSRRIEPPDAFEMKRGMPLIGLQ